MGVLMGRQVDKEGVATNHVVWALNSVRDRSIYGSMSGFTNQC